MTPRDPLLSYLCTRNLAMRDAHNQSDDEAAVSTLLDRAIALENAIMATPAVSVEGLASKLMLTVEASLEGGEMSFAQAQALVREGRDSFGIGDFITREFEQENAA